MIRSSNDKLAETKVTIRQIVFVPASPSIASPAVTHPTVVKATSPIPNQCTPGPLRPSFGSNQLLEVAVKKSPGFEAGSFGIGTAVKKKWTSP